MTDQAPAYYVIIYTADDWTDAVSGDRRPLISAPVWAKTPEEASHRITNARQGRNALNVAGPFATEIEAESYRRTWARDQGKRTIATLLDETASVIHTISLRDRPGRTPAQNNALPPVVNLYQAFNIVAGGVEPDDTRGSRNGVNSADLVRTFAGFLNVRSPLEWSGERTSDEIVTALRACASSLRTPIGQTDTDPADTEETGPGFPVVCASVHEHNPEDCVPAVLADDVTADDATAETTVWSVTAESFEGTDVPAETFVRISDMDSLIKAHRAAGASVEVSWPFGSDGTEPPTYVHLYVDGRGVVTFRRANQGEGR